MAVPKLKYSAGNSASTTGSAAVTNSDTSFPLTATTNFQAKTGEGMILMDEGQATEELAYSTGLSGGSLTIPVANRGLEGTSAAGHSNGYSVKGIFSALMWNDLIDSLKNILDQTTGAVDTTKVVNIGSTQTITGNKIFNDIDFASTDPNLATGLNIQVNALDPKRAIYIPASAMIARTTNGAAAGSAETSTNKVMIKSYDFDASTNKFVQFQIPSPKYWDAGTITAEFYWTAASSSGDVIFGLQGLALSNDDALDTAFGTAQTVTDTLTATNDVCVTSATSAITVGNTPTSGDWIVFQVYRDAAAGGDTLGADAKLLGVRIQFAIKQYDDQ